MSKKYLFEVQVLMVKRVIVEAESKADAVDIASTISVESLALGEADEAVVLGDEPSGNGSGSVYLVAEEGTTEWSQNFEGVN